MPHTLGGEEVSRVPEGVPAPEVRATAERIELHLRTADLVIDRNRGLLIILAEQETDEQDWKEICRYAAAVGITEDIDIGEPADVLGVLNLWEIKLPPPVLLLTTGRPWTAGSVIAGSGIHCLPLSKPGGPAARQEAPGA
jgi:hypothetical protein